MSYLDHLLTIVQTCKGFLSSRIESEENEFVELTFLEEYKRLRRISREVLFENIVTKIDTHIILECAKKLGLYYKRAVRLSRDENASVLLDYATYHYRVVGKNAIERYSLRHRKILGTEEKQILEYNKKAYFSLFKVKKCLNNGWVILLDVFRDTELLLIDEGLSKTGSPDFLLLSNIVPCGSFYMTTGATILLTLGDALNKVMALFLRLPKKYSCYNDLPKDKESNLIAKMLKVCLEMDVMKNTMLMEVE